MRDLMNMPSRMNGRPLDHRGFPVPWFVTMKTDKGLWDFRRVTHHRKLEAVRSQVCWVSGEKLGRFRAFVVGPMCIINRVSSDPPVIPEIGQWSARICPFLSNPLAKRPEFSEEHSTPGVMISDNPGLCAAWITRTDSYDRKTGLFSIGEATQVSWWMFGEEVTRANVDRAQRIFETRANQLKGYAEEEGGEALEAFEVMYERAKNWQPKEVCRD